MYNLKKVIDSRETRGMDSDNGGRKDCNIQ